MFLIELPHRRFNPLTREWVIVSPQRTRRPWLGLVENTQLEDLPPYDPSCYLCPNNPRSGGQRNPDYASTYVFDNDFPALLSPAQATQVATSQAGVGAFPQSELFRAEAEYGICRVVCFSPRHDLNLPHLTQGQVSAVVHTWIEQIRELGGREFTGYVQVFENKGAMMGASNPHPHSQVWATNHVPNEPGKEIIAQAEYLSRQGSCLLCDYLSAEIQAGERVVVANEAFTALVPFWAIWPFEVLLLANRHLHSLTNLEDAEVAGLADLMRRLTTRYDNLFETSFPYSMGFHQAPTDGLPHTEHHLHAHYYPPLLRSATVRKFMVGYEMLASPQRDLTPEAAAERLRSVSEPHFRWLEARIG